MQDMEQPHAAEVDLSGLDYTELSKLRGRADELMREMRETGGPALREEFAQRAAAIGMTLEEVVQLGAKRRGRPPKDKEED